MADTPPWSQLPADLLQTISNRFDTSVDILTLRSVCSSWRSSISPFKKNPLPLPSNLPLPEPLLLPTVFQDRIHCHVSLTESTIYILQNPNSSTSKSADPKCWLIRNEETGEGKLRPLNPFSKILTDKSPSDFSKSLNLLDFRITEIGKSYTLDFVDSSPHVEDDINLRCGPIRELLESQNRNPMPVVVSPDPRTDNAGDYTLIGMRNGSLCFIKVEDKTWKFFKNLQCCDDVVFHKGKFYVVNHRGRTVAIDSDLMRKREVTGPLFCSGKHKHLVKSCDDDDLFLVDMYMEYEEEEEFVNELPDNYFEYAVSLRVFKLNEKEKKWSEVDSLRDQVFFVCYGCSYSVRARDFPGLKGNCIYFLHNFIHKGENEGKGKNRKHIWVYQLEDGEYGPMGLSATFTDLLATPDFDWLKFDFDWSKFNWN